MSVSTIDPKPALIVVDLQQGIVGLQTAHDMAGVVRQSADLAAAFRKHGLPVVLVNVTGGAPGRTQTPPRSAGQERPADWADIVAELDPQPGDLRVTKRTWGAFHGTTLDAQLRELGVTQVVVVGVATSAGVESTARAAHEQGYHVVLATDAMTDMNAGAHDNSVQRIFPRIGETGTSAEIIELLDTTR